MAHEEIERYPPGAESKQRPNKNRGTCEQIIQLRTEALPDSRMREPLVQPSPSLSRLVRNIGIRKLIRQGCGRRIIEKISLRELVKVSTYREYERRIEEYARRRQRPKHSL